MLDSCRSQRDVIQSYCTVGLVVQAVTAPLSTFVVVGSNSIQDSTMCYPQIVIEKVQIRKFGEYYTGTPTHHTTLGFAAGWCVGIGSTKTTQCAPQKRGIQELLLLRYPDPSQSLSTLMRVPSAGKFSVQGMYVT